MAVKSNSSEQNWDIVVKPKQSLFNLNLKEVWAYKDLIFLMVKRDITAQYKQTILGPVWMLIQPIFTTIVFTITFGYIAKIKTDGVPSMLFYMIGLTFWTYFADCLNKTASTFTANASIFGKVYFPRLVIPISVIISNIIKLLIQFTLLLLFWFYFLIKTNTLTPQYHLLILLPFLLLMLALLGLAFGLIASSLTTKYRDFTFLLGFGVQLFMYGSCIIFPISLTGIYSKILMYNPVAAIIEAIRFIFTGSGYFSIQYLSIAFLFTTLLMAFALIIFNKTEKSFMDTV